MANTNARREILEMVASGQITAAEAADLLKSNAPPPPETPEPPQAEAPTPPPAPESFKAPKAAEAPNAGNGGNGKKPSWFHVRVSDSNTGRTKVSVNIPLRLLKFGVRFGQKFAPEVEGLDWDDIQTMLNEGMEGGVLVDVQDEEDGEHVQIYVD
jgi:hypothetical protein